MADDDNPYVPLNSPAIGDLFDLFRFDHKGGRDDHWKCISAQREGGPSAAFSLHVP